MPIVCRRPRPGRLLGAACAVVLSSPILAQAVSLTMGRPDLSGTPVNSLRCEQVVSSSIFCAWWTQLQTVPGEGSQLIVPVEGTLTAWRLRGSASGGGEVHLLVLRPAGTGFRCVAKSEAASFFDGVTPNYASLEVEAGDQLAVALQNDFFAPYDDGVAEIRTAFAADASRAGIALLIPGATVAAPSFAVLAEELLMNATLELEPPAVTAMAPTSGPPCGGTTVTIAGQHLAGVTGVTFGGVPAASFSQVGGGVTAVSPPHGAGAVDVQMHGIGGVSPAVPLTVFTYVTDYAAVGAQLEALRAAVSTTTCEGAPLPKRLRGKLGGKLRQAGRQVKRAAAGGPEAKVTRSADRADALAGAVESILTRAAGKLAAGCLDSLQASLGEARRCLGR
jgi:hypothetical protein